MKIYSTENLTQVPLDNFSDNRTNHRLPHGRASCRSSRGRKERSDGGSSLAASPTHTHAEATRKAIRGREYGETHLREIARVAVLVVGAARDNLDPVTVLRRARWRGGS